MGMHEEISCSHNYLIEIKIYSDFNKCALINGDCTMLKNVYCGPAIRNNTNFG